MRVELRVEARHDLLEGTLFYEHQRHGLGDYFTDRLDRLELYRRLLGVRRPLQRWPRSARPIERLSQCSLS